MDRKRGITGRELAGPVILVMLLLAGMLSAWYLNRQHTAMAEAMEDSSWMALSGQWENAGELAMSVRQDWEKDWRLRAVMTDHSPMEEIDTLFRELTVYEAAGERTEFARSCAVLAEKLKSIASSGGFSWWNVL